VCSPVLKARRVQVKERLLRGSQDMFLGPKTDVSKKEESSSIRKQISNVVQSAKDALKQGLDPETLMQRGILVMIPAIAMCILRFFCIGFSGVCMNISIKPRTLRGLLFGVPMAPLVHLSNSQLVVDMLGWCSLGFGMTAYGTRFFVLAITFLTIGSGVPTWLFGGPDVVHAGTSGILFGIFAFHLSILPFRRPLHWADVASFCVFDLGFGGIWWFEHYDAPGASKFLSVSGLFAGVAFAWVYFRIFSEDLDVQETLPLFGSSLLYVEKATESAVDAAAHSGVRKIERISADALAAANTQVQEVVAEHTKAEESAASHENPYHHWNP